MEFQIKNHNIFGLKLKTVNLIFVFLFLVSCNNQPGLNSPENIDFGDPYSLSSGFCGTPPVPPVAILDQQDTLRIGVFYSGGCKEHDFFLNYVINDHALLWLTHDSHGDACEAAIWDWVSIELPSPLSNYREHLYILDPETEEEILVLVQDSLWQTATGLVSFIELEGGFWGIITDNGMRLDPMDSLPASYRKNDLKVWIKYRVLPDQGSYHMWGKMIELLEIREE